MSDTNELLRQKFAELTAEETTVRASIAPEVAERDGILAEIEALNERAKALTVTIRERADADLIRIAKERSTLVKFLNGQTGR